MPTPGRPKKKLPPPHAPLTRRVRRLIDEVHGGNLGEAQRATGIAYPTLRALYVGSTANPSLRTLEALAAPYGLPLGWFTDPEGRDTLPVRGVIGLLPPHPSVPQRRHRLRQVPIPFAAWPLPHVYRGLARWLEGLPPSPGRPIVHEATGDSFTFRLTSFLLQPLLAAERLGEPDVIPFAPDDEPVVPGDEVGAHWILQLRALGATWEVVLEDVLDRARSSAG